MKFSHFIFVTVFSADFHRCNKALSAKDQDTSPCVWYQRVYKSLCPISWVSSTKYMFIEGTYKDLRDRYVDLTKSTNVSLSQESLEILPSLSLMQVQKWDEQLEAGSFPGKI